MKKWYWATFAIPLIFFMAGSSWFFRYMPSPQDPVRSFCMLKPNANSQEFQAFVAQGLSSEQCVKQFIAQKKDAAMQAVQKEWQINAEQFVPLLQRTDHYLAHMKGALKEGHEIHVPRTFKNMQGDLKRMISDIMSAHGIVNGSIELVSSPPHGYPTIFFHDRTPSYDALPHFLLELPRGFEHEPEIFQRGNLEHELAHMACGHSIAVNDVSRYLADRDRIPREEILNSESFQKWMRACEYEADLLPSLKNTETAHSLLCALNAVKITDDAHPSTRKRKKMVMRVKRLGELESPSAQIL